MRRDTARASRPRRGAERKTREPSARCRSDLLIRQGFAGADEPGAAGNARSGTLSVFWKPLISH